MTQPTLSALRHLLASSSGDTLDALLAEHRGDTRAGARALVEAAQRRRGREVAEQERLVALCAHEESLYARGVRVVAGVDEVGRGALAGPVTAAACVLPRGVHIVGVTDSKLLTPKRRAELDVEIRAAAVATSVAHVSPERIDHVGIAVATVEAMRAAVEGLGCAVEHVLVDGLPVDLGHPSTAVVKGDSRVRAIAAASIVAKVARDALLIELGSRYPGYGLESHKGYGCEVHLAAIRALGPTPVHRRSFGPCMQDRLF